MHISRRFEPPLSRDVCFPLPRTKTKNGEQKMSGRWGHRPLGRGGWRDTSNPKRLSQPAVLPRSRAANSTQEIACSKGQTTSDYSSSLLCARFRVDRSGGSFIPVLSPATEVLHAGTEVPVLSSHVLALLKSCARSPEAILPAHASALAPFRRVSPGHSPKTPPGASAPPKGSSSPSP